MYCIFSSFEISLPERISHVAEEADGAPVDAALLLVTRDAGAAIIFVCGVFTSAHTPFPPLRRSDSPLSTSNKTWKPQCFFFI